MKYVLGVDFGTLSARAVLLRVSDGAQVATAASGYGAYDVALPGGLSGLAAVHDLYADRSLPVEDGAVCVRLGVGEGLILA